MSMPFSMAALFQARNAEFHHPHREAEQFLSLSIQMASNAACQANLSADLIECCVFWNQPCSLIVCDTSRTTVVDFDKVGVFVERMNQGHKKDHLWWALR